VNEKGTIVQIDNNLFVEKIGESYLESMRKRIGEAVVKVDPEYFRPTEVELLIGDATKARTKLSWEPKYNLDLLIEDMIQNDVKEMKKEAYLKEAGYRIMNYFE
ncbi:MAG: GDP-mannose 4,6-dehydratase, partial [Dysgonamonadaceae bacterium]|nr:GDP-mannose 4,6-dehydratase [Dysgonamonadaceae bacterium]